MITEWILTVAASLLEFLVSLVPDWEIPAELLDPNGALASVMGLAQGIEPFAAWGLIGILAAIPPGVWFIGILWKAARQLFSHFPGFGGSG